MKETSASVPRSERLLVLLLRFIGCFDLLAVAAAALPGAWFSRAHEELNLGELPASPVVGYLARSTSLMYALYGAILIFISLDIRAHWRLVRFLAIAAYVHGTLIIVIDIKESLPTWWIVGEGGYYLGSATVILSLWHLVDKDRHVPVEPLG